MTFSKIGNGIILKKILWFTIVPLITFAIFKIKIDELISLLIVKPLLSSVNTYWLNDVITISSCFFLAYIFIKKISKGVIIPCSWYFIALTFSIIYLVYRIKNEPFSFTSFSFSNSIKLLDLHIFTLFIIAIASALYKKTNNKPFEDKALSFDIDEPITLTKENDTLNRLKFIKNLALIIANTNLKDGSFPIGIVSPWGSGKTTFLKSLKNEINRYEIITIEFNLWKNSSSTQIIETFFRLLKQSLKPFSFSINNKLSEYAYNLIKGTKSDFLKSFSEVFIPNDNLENQYKSINAEIKQINKKILILIDDIDRLNKTEIYEVIRLIRNTANFSNIYFVVAYDRNYILNAIEDINSYQSHIFLEKIFQVEFSLPPIENHILENEIKTKLSVILTEAGKTSYEAFVSNSNFSFNKADLTRNFISNMRDVIRFVNSFHINYLYVKDEIYFHDFYNLELIRFKHPEIFAEFFRNKEQYLFSGTKKNVFPIKPFTYALRKVHANNEKNIKGDFVLRLHLQDHIDIYKINLYEIDLLVNSFSKIFPQHESPETSKWGVNSHLSVVIPSMIDRYFRLGIDGKLSEIDFSKARTLEAKELCDKVEEWCLKHLLADEVAERFIQIDDFDNQSDFKKIITAIFYMANLPNPKAKDRQYQQYIGYDGKSLASLLGRDSIIKSLFDNDVNDYKTYLLSIFNIKVVKYNYTHDFVNFLLHNGSY